MFRKTKFALASAGAKWFLLLVLVAVVIQAAYGWLALPIWLVPAGLFIYYRDPYRVIPSEPLGIISPVDGKVIDIASFVEEESAKSVQQVSIRVDRFGAYSLRGATEGKVMDGLCKGTSGGSRVCQILVVTDEGDEVVMASQYDDARQHRWPFSAQIGERVGQGKRCGISRGISVLKLELDSYASVKVKVGDTLLAGADVVAVLNHDTPRA